MFSYEATFVPVGGSRGAARRPRRPSPVPARPVCQRTALGMWFTLHLRLIGKKRRPRGQFVSTVVRCPNEESREGDHLQGFPAILPLGFYLSVGSSLIETGSTRDRRA